MHQKDSKNLPTALEMLRTATVIKGAAGAAGANAPAAANVVRVTSPDGKWALVFDLPDAQPADTDRSDDGKSTQLKTLAGQVICSAFIEPATKAGDAKVVRAFYWSKERQAPLQYSNIKMLGDDKLAILEYTVDGTDPNIHGYLVHEGTWIDIHLSRPAGTAADTAAMEKAIKSARFEPLTK